MGNTVCWFKWSIAIFNRLNVWKNSVERAKSDNNWKMIAMEWSVLSMWSVCVFIVLSCLNAIRYSWWISTWYHDQLRVFSWNQTFDAHICSLFLLSLNRNHPTDQYISLYICEAFYSITKQHSWLASTTVWMRSCVCVYKSHKEYKRINASRSNYNNSNNYLTSIHV